MVVRIPPSGEWCSVTDSTLVHKVAFDEAAERIFVRLKPRGLVVFEECDIKTWQRFCTEGISKGAYVTQVLSAHPYTEL